MPERRPALDRDRRVKEPKRQEGRRDRRGGAAGPEHAQRVHAAALARLVALKALHGGVGRDVKADEHGRGLAGAERCFCLCMEGRLRACAAARKRTSVCGAAAAAPASQERETHAARERSSNYQA